MHEREGGVPDPAGGSGPGEAAGAGDAASAHPSTAVAPRPAGGAGARDSLPPQMAVLRFVRPWFPAVHRVAPPFARWLAATLFCTPPPGRRPSARSREVLRSARSGIIAVEGRRVRCWCWGAGPAVFLVHGWAGRATQLGSFVEPLVRQGFRVVAFDAPGHGASEGKTSTILHFAATLDRLAAEHGAPHAVVAHSFGAAATAFAAARGLDAGRVVFLGAAARMLDYFRTFLGGIGIPRPAWAAYERDIERRFGIDWADLSVPGLAPRMRAPLLALHDRDDAEAPWQESAAIVEAWPRARLVTTSGLGHRGILRDPGVVRGVVDFLV